MLLWSASKLTLELSLYLEEEEEGRNTAGDEENCRRRGWTTREDGREARRREGKVGI